MEDYLIGLHFGMLMIVLLMASCANDVLSIL